MRDEGRMILDVRQYADCGNHVETPGEGKSVAPTHPKPQFGVVDDTSRTLDGRGNLRSRQVSPMHIEIAPRQCDAKLAGPASDIEDTPAMRMLRNDLGNERGAPRIERLRVPRCLGETSARMRPERGWIRLHAIASAHAGSCSKFDRRRVESVGYI
jgi:hypothetical protein